MRIALIALALAASPAAAQDFYGSVFGGYSNLDDPTFSGDVAAGGQVGPQTVGTDFDSGFGLGVALGYRLPGLAGTGLSLRGEIELSYSDSDVDGIAFSGNGPDPEANVAGDITTTRLFANLIADVETASRFTPYFGGGIGVARSDLGLSYGAQPGAVNLDDNSTDFTAQLIVGTAYSLTDTVSLIGDVRYIRDFGVSGDRFTPAGLSGNVSDDISTINVNVGLRFEF